MQRKLGVNQRGKPSANACVTEGEIIYRQIIRKRSAGIKITFRGQVENDNIEIKDSFAGQ